MNKYVESCSNHYMATSTIKINNSEIISDYCLISKRLLFNGNLILCLMNSVSLIFIGCPIDHQYVFDNGRKCCSTNRKTNDSNLNNTFNGGDLLFDSISCAGTFIDCPIQQQYGGCLNLGKITNTLFFKFGRVMRIRVS